MFTVCRAELMGSNQDQYKEWNRPWFLGVLVYIGRTRGFFRLCIDGGVC